MAASKASYFQKFSNHSQQDGRKKNTSIVLAMMYYCNNRPLGEERDFELMLSYAISLWKSVPGWLEVTGSILSRYLVGSMILEMAQTTAKAEKVTWSKCPPQIPLMHSLDWHLPHPCPMPLVLNATSVLLGGETGTGDTIGLSREGCPWKLAETCRSLHASSISTSHTLLYQILLKLQTWQSGSDQIANFEARMYHAVHLTTWCQTSVATLFGRCGASRVHDTSLWFVWWRCAIDMNNLFFVMPCHSLFCIKFC